MKVTYGGIVLAAGGLQGATGLSINGQQENDEAGIFRAAAQTYFQRGNRSTSFGFGVNLPFNNEAAALTFAALWINSLPTSGSVVIQDDAGQTTVTLAGAVLDSVNCARVDGTFVLVRYQFSGGVFA